MKLLLHFTLPRSTAFFYVPDECLKRQKHIVYNILNNRSKVLIYGMFLYSYRASYSRRFK